MLEFLMYKALEVALGAIETVANIKTAHDGVKAVTTWAKRKIGPLRKAPPQTARIVEEFLGEFQESIKDMKALGLSDDLICRILLLFRFILAAVKMFWLFREMLLPNTKKGKK